MLTDAPLKVAVIGGGGFRTPRLLYGLVRHAAEIGIADVALYDTDPGRVRVMETLGTHLARTVGSPIRVRAVCSLPETVQDAAFVLFTIRPGGEMGRVYDERASRQCGVLGQETVGPGGFFLALRTLGVLERLVAEVRTVNPDAWLINFSNPVGIVSEGALRWGERRFVGVCDTPHHLKQELAAYVAVPPAELQVETVGLNHLGWFLALRHKERDLLPEVLDNFEAVREQVRPLSFFSPDEVRSVAALPTEYVYLYLHGQDVARRLKSAKSRGEQVAERSEGFFREAAPLLQAEDGASLLTLYTRVLAARSNSYFAAETETLVDRGLHPSTILATESYERVAIDTMKGLTGSPDGSTVILNVPEAGAGGVALAAPAVMELACRVGPEAISPVPLTRAVPEVIQSWIRAVKRYEVATVKAFQAGDEAALVHALALNPLVPSKNAARSLLAARRAFPGGLFVSGQAS